MLKEPYRVESFGFNFQCSQVTVKSLRRFENGLTFNGKVLGMLPGVNVPVVAAHLPSLLERLPPSFICKSERGHVT
jgi:hypothetical protein